MTFRSLAAVPIALGAVVLVGVAAIEAEVARTIFFRVEVEAVKLLALFGCMAAAAAFERGDYLRRAWGLVGACMLLLLVRDLTIIPAVGAALGPRAEGIRTVIVTVANLLSIAGSWFFACTWRVAQIDLPGSARGKRTAFTLTALLVTSLALYAAFFDVQALGRGQERAWVSLASDAGDILSLWFIAPVMLTALAMRGGLLMWPWAFQTASLLAWLAYDGTVALDYVAGAGPLAIKTTSEFFRALACGSSFAAGMAQCKVVRSQTG